MKEPIPTTVLVGTKDEVPPAPASGASVQAERERVNSRKTVNNTRKGFLYFIFLNIIVTYTGLIQKRFR